jgi:hypothetical protein
MKIQTIPTEKFESKRKERNLELYGYHSDSCEICGKPQNDNKANQKYLHMTNGGNYINVQSTEADGITIKGHEHESQGFFPIGNTCAKKFPKSFIFQYD